MKFIFLNNKVIVYPSNTIQLQYNSLIFPKRLFKINLHRVEKYKIKSIYYTFLLNDTLQIT